MKSIRISGVLLLCAGLLVLAARGSRGDAAPDPFTELATFRGVGAPLRDVVGPGPVPGSERYYVSYAYTGNTADIVEIDPETGAYETYTSPDPTVSNIWALVAGPDGNLYGGTYGTGKILRINPVERTIEDLGRASQTETQIWSFALGTDSKIYGCTFPNAKLIRFDPATGVSEDLGRMDPNQQYARSIAAGPDGFIYTDMGVGAQRHQVAAYEISTGEHRDILPSEYGTYPAQVYKGVDGNAYLLVFRPNAWLYFRLEGWSLTPVDEETATRAPSNRLSDGREVTSIYDGQIEVKNPTTEQTVTHPFLYEGKEISVYRLEFGPAGKVYGCTAQPFHLFRVETRTKSISPVAYLGFRKPGGGSGDAQSLLSYGGSLILPSYASFAPILIYNPELPVNVSADAPDANPSLVAHPGTAIDWRAQSIVPGPLGRVYIGSYGGYGVTTGLLTVLNPVSRQVESFHAVIPGQAISSLAAWKTLIVGGTTDASAATQARLFLWDPSTGQKLFDTVPVLNASHITDLVAAPNGLVFGVAGSLTVGGKTLFVFDPATRSVRYVAPLTTPIITNANVRNSLTVASDGRIYGLFVRGIFSIDPTTFQSRVEALYSRGAVTAGFGFDGESLYFGSGSHVVRYTIHPSPPAAPSNLSARAFDGRIIRLSWTDNAANEQGFVVERSTDGTSWSELAVVGPRAGTGQLRTYEDTGLDEGRQYFYRVYAWNAYPSANSNVASDIAGDRPPPPSNLTAASTLSGIRITWSDNSQNETIFRIERSANGVNFASYTSAGAAAGSGTTLQYLDRQALGGVYWYRVAACNRLGLSAYSNIASN